MTTVEKIKSAALNKGWAIEKSAKQIGVNYFPSMWAWFNVCDNDAFFNQVYSQNTGAVKKSFRKGFQIEALIEKALK